MPNVLIYKARTLKPQTRAAVEAELGRSQKAETDFKKNDKSSGVHAASSVEAAPSATRRKGATEHYRGGAE